MKRSRSKKPTLSDKISSLLTVAPAEDPEDDIYKETKARTVNFDDSDYDNNSDIDTALSSFRKQNVKLLEDVDEKYRGKKVSRKILGLQQTETESEVSSDSDVESTNFADKELTSEDDSGSGEINEKITDKEEDTLNSKISNISSGSESEVMPTDDSDYENTELFYDSEDIESDAENENIKTNGPLASKKTGIAGSFVSEEYSGGDSDSESAEDDSANFGDDSINQEDTKFNHMNKINTSEEIQKGNCVRHQLSIWENLLELRIHSQKLLLSGNRLPYQEDFKEFKNLAGPEFQKSLNETRKNVSNVLNKFLELQKVLLKCFPETKTLGKEEKVSDTGMNEEIPSDTEDEKESKESDSEVEDVPIKRRKINDYAKILAEQHLKYTPYRNSVVQKWHDKTRIAAGNLKSKILTSTSLIKHIEFVLNDKDRLRRRTQLKRSSYDVIGSKNTVPQNKHENDFNVNKKEEKGTEEVQDIYCPEIFDDNDFYHQLLRELIEFKSSDISDPIQLSKQWIEFQQLRNKMKRKVDTRATKGRKIRYVVHSKLVNYMAPENTSSWTDEAKDELFGSLFGTRKTN